jgi:hypothetical protein
MELHLLDLFSAPLWALISAIFFPTLAAIATFVCLRRAKLSHKLAGFFTLIPLYVAVTVIVCGDTGGLISKILPPFGIYPLIGFLASLCLGILCLNFTAVTCGIGALKRKGAVINTVSSLVCFGINAYLTYSAWNFAKYTYENKLFRYDGGRMDIKDALPYLYEVGFLPDALLDAGIEIPVIAVLLVFLTVYFLSFIAIKSPEEISRDDIERRRRAALSKRSGKRRKKDEEDDDTVTDCCAYCEYAECLKSDHMKMLCRHHGVVAHSHVCRKYVYDPLKRKAFRPRISPLVQSESETDDII